MKSTEIEAEQVVSTSGLLTGRPNTRSPRWVSADSWNSNWGPLFFFVGYFQHYGAVVTICSISFTHRSSPPSTALYMMQLPHKLTHEHPLSDGEQLSCCIWQDLRPQGPRLCPNLDKTISFGAIGVEISPNYQQAMPGQFRPVPVLLSGIQMNDLKHHPHLTHWENSSPPCLWPLPPLPILIFFSFIEL